VNYNVLVWEFSVEWYVTSTTVTGDNDDGRTHVTSLKFSCVVLEVQIYSVD
jgi:hypothetical protein